MQIHMQIVRYFASQNFPSGAYYETRKIIYIIKVFNKLFRWILLLLCLCFIYIFSFSVQSPSLTWTKINRTIIENYIRCRNQNWRKVGAGNWEISPNLTWSWLKYKNFLRNWFLGLYFDLKTWNYIFIYWNYIIIT